MALKKNVTTKIFAAIICVFVCAFAFAACGEDKKKDFAQSSNSSPIYSGDTTATESESLSEEESPRQSGEVSASIGQSADDSSETSVSDEQSAVDNSETSASDEQSAVDSSETSVSDEQSAGDSGDQSIEDSTESSGSQSSQGFNPPSNPIEESTYSAH